MLLDKIDSTADLRKLKVEQLPQLCGELRSYILDCCSSNPGHLASSLGAVEIIVALHYVYDTPDDRIVFDVGHQAYAHKILTGRREAFRTMRTEGGISGFPSREESVYDAFGVGHSSTSVSAALGIAEAIRLQGRDEKVVAVIGDGALTGGLAFEGLNNAGASQSDLLIILNDNNQSIDSNIGGLHDHLLKMTTSSSYNRIKTRIWNILGERNLRDFIQRWARAFKSWLVKRSGGDFFEALGLRYFGPVDGHNVIQLVATLSKLRGMKGPQVLHCITVKGKGYAPAENDPTVWHAPGKFDLKTGSRLKTGHDADRYQDVFGEVLCELADADSRITGITPAMSSGCGMTVFAKRFPDRFFDVGIEEEHAVTFSAGLAAEGMKAFCNIYSAFSQRAYDQIIHDVALQKLPVVFCFDRAGLVGEDGATHNGTFDIAAYRSIPGIVISAPADEVELKRLMHTAALYNDGPFIIRYPRGCGEGRDWRKNEGLPYTVGTAEEMAKGNGIAIIASGPCVNRALEAAAAFPGKVGVYNFRFIKPLDTKMLESIGRNYSGILTVEDGALKGGLFGAVCEFFAGKEGNLIIRGAGVPDRFIAHGPQKRQQAECGIDSAGIGKALSGMFTAVKGK